MPKIVDHDHKRKMIAETAWKIIETEGIEKASIRRIASETGMSTRALRHYFSNKMNYYYLLWNIFLLMRKNGRRVKKTSYCGISVVRISYCGNRDKQTEPYVWLVFAIRPLTSSFEHKKDELTEGEYILMKALLETLIKASYVNKDINIKIEKLKLSAALKFYPYMLY